MCTWCIVYCVWGGGQGTYWRYSHTHSSEVFTTQQLEAAVEALKGTSCDAKTRSLIAVLDEDHDGNVNLEELAEGVRG